MEQDLWLTAIMGTNCYKVNCDSINEYLYIRNSLSDIESSFITVKTRVKPENSTYGSKKQIRWVSSMNSYIWDCRKKDVNIYAYEPNDFIEAVEIAGNSFSTDRFHCDPRISKLFANKIKQEWLSANLKESRKTTNLIYKHPNNLKVVAFCSLLVRDDFLLIDLIAVSQEFRGRGIGKALISSSQLIAADSGMSLLVGTQVENNANQLYVTSGFVAQEQTFVFHDTNEIIK
jgi:ribosomal protein S18 acetylase RimI-like enzyme